jgi:hypothetical protein
MRSDFLCVHGGEWRVSILEGMSHVRLYHKKTCCVPRNFGMLVYREQSKVMVLGVERVSGLWCKENFTIPILRHLFLFLNPLAWRCENLFAHQSSLSPSHSPHHYPFTPVEPGYRVDLFEDNYLLLLAADLRMDPALRPRPVSSLTSVTVHNSTTRLNDGIFTVRRFSVATSTRLRESECVYRFYVYGGISDNPPGFLYLHVEQFVFVFVLSFCGLRRSGEVWRVE